MKTVCLLLGAAILASPINAQVSAQQGGDAAWAAIVQRCKCRAIGRDSRFDAFVTGPGAWEMVGTAEARFAFDKCVTEETDPDAMQRKREQAESRAAAADAASRELQWRVEQLTRTFESDKKDLFERLRPLVADLDERSGYGPFRATARAVQQQTAWFRSRYWLIEKHRAVSETFQHPNKLTGHLQVIDRAWTAERANAEDTALLAAEQGKPTNVRDPRAHPNVIESNLKASADRQQKAAKERMALLTMTPQLVRETLGP